MSAAQIATAPQLCDPSIVKEQCAKLNHGTREYFNTVAAYSLDKVHAAELADMFSMPRTNVIDHLTSMGIRFGVRNLTKEHVVDCMELCQMNLQTIPPARLPPASDVGCVTLSTGRVCDIDLSPGRLQSYVATTEKLARDEVNDGVLAAIASTEAASRATAANNPHSDRGEVQLAKLSDLTAASPEIAYAWDARQFSVGIASMFRIYCEGDSTVMLDEELELHVPKPDDVHYCETEGEADCVPYSSQCQDLPNPGLVNPKDGSHYSCQDLKHLCGQVLVLETCPRTCQATCPPAPPPAPGSRAETVLLTSVIAQAFIFRALISLATHEAPQKVQRWLGKITTDQRREVVRQMIGSSMVFLGANFLMGLQEICTGGTLAYVIAGQLDRRGRYKVYVCETFFEKKIPQQIQVISHESLHHLPMARHDMCLEPRYSWTCGIDQKAYGAQRTQELAFIDTQDAVTNADSIALLINDVNGPHYYGGCWDQPHVQGIARPVRCYLAPCHSELVQKACGFTCDLNCNAGTLGTKCEDSEITNFRIHGAMLTCKESAYLCDMPAFSEELRRQCPATCGVC